MLNSLQSQFGVSHSANHKFFFLDEDSDVLTVSSEQEFGDNDELLQMNGGVMPWVIYANLNDLASVDEQLKGKQIDPV